MRSQSNRGPDTPALKSFVHKVGRSVEGKASLRSINATYKPFPWDLALSIAHLPVSGKYH